MELIRSYIEKTCDCVQNVFPVIPGMMVEFVYMYGDRRKHRRGVYEKSVDDYIYLVDHHGYRIARIIDFQVIGWPL